MFEAIIDIDTRLFMLFNSQLTNGFFDWFMPFITNAKTWVPLIFFVWLFFVIRGSRRTRIIAFAALIATGSADLFCARVLKKNIYRPRPCSVEETDTFRSRMLIRRRSSMSFPSNHAANTAAFASTVFWGAGYKFGLPLGFMAFMSGYSRVYCGVHYPFDVMTGWLIGAFIGWLTFRIFVWFKPELLESHQQNCDQSMGEPECEEHKSGVDEQTQQES